MEKDRTGACLFNSSCHRETSDECSYQEPLLGHVLLGVLFFCFEMILLLNADGMILGNSRNSLKSILFSVGEVQIVKFRNITSCRHVAAGEAAVL